MFLADQGRDAVIIRRIITFQKFPLIGPPSSIGEVFLGPFYYYLVAPFLFLSQSNPVGLAIGVALLSVAAIYIIHVLVQKLVSSSVVVLLSIFLIFSALLVDVGRFSWNPNLLPYFSFITMGLFYLSLHEKRQKLYAFLFGILFGFSFQLHHLAALLALPILIYFGYHAVRIRKIRVIQAPLIALLGFGTTLLPFLLFEFRHDFLNMRNLITLFTKQNLVSSGPVINRLIDVTSAVVQFALNIKTSAFIACSIALLIIGLVIGILRKKNNSFTLLQLITFITLLFGLSRVNAQAIPHYFHIVYISFYFLIAVIVNELIKKNWRAAGILLMLVFIALQIPSYTFFWSKPARQYALPERIGGQIAKLTQGERINLTTYPTDFTSRDCYQYYIELNGGSVVDGSSNEVAQSLFVLCDKQPCRIINSDSWNIQMFGNAEIDTMWNTEGVSIYKLIHR